MGMSQRKDRERADRLLVARGLVRSRAQAGDLVRRGLVLADGAPVAKPGQLLGVDARLEVAPGAAARVSRAGEKLAHALTHFGLDAEGRIALDIGASTGGFTEVLLEAGVRRVHAVDVGRGQLAPRLGKDPRVVSLEGVDARALGPEHVPGPVGAITVDVSFISLALVLPHVLPFAAPGAWLVALVKPQFECGPEAVGRGGVVRSEAARRKAVRAVSAAIARETHWRVLGAVPSPIAGRAGNVEYLLAARYAPDGSPAPDGAPAPSSRST